MEKDIEYRDSKKEMEPKFRFPKFREMFDRKVASYEKEFNRKLTKKEKKIKDK